MVVLSLDDVALVLFDFGRRGLEDFHIHDVVSTVDAVGLVTTDEHPDFLWHTLSRHIANTSTTQIVKVKSDVFCLLIRIARRAFTSLGDTRLAISTLDAAANCDSGEALKNPDQKTAAYSERVFMLRPELIFVARFEIPAKSVLF
jgi:hypothetical protein